MTIAFDPTLNHGHSVNWTKWLGHLAGKPNLNFLEIGSYEGQSAIWFLRNILTASNSRITCVDTWEAGEDLPLVLDDSLSNAFREHTEPWRHQIDMFVDRSDVILPMLSAESFDVAYIDGSHTANNVLMDSVLTWRLVKPGGIVIWDDYGWVVNPNPIMQPKMAIDAFLACYQGQYEMISLEWQACLRKRKRDNQGNKA